MSYFNSPAQTLFLELSRAQGDLNQKRQEQWASRPGTLDQLVQYSEMYPQGSASLGLALLQGGIPATDPMAGQLVEQEMLARPNQGPIENAGEGFWDDLTGAFGDVVLDPLKGTTRWAMSAWDAAYNMVAVDSSPCTKNRKRFNPVTG